MRRIKLRLQQLLCHTARLQQGYMCQDRPLQLRLNEICTSHNLAIRDFQSNEASWRAATRCSMVASGTCSTTGVSVSLHLGEGDADFADVLDHGGDVVALVPDQLRPPLLADHNQVCLPALCRSAKLTGS